MAREIPTMKVKHSTVQVLTLLLLVLYVAGTSHLEYLHSLSHSHEVAIPHSDEQEKNPCHRFIYHNDIEQGCDHDSHLVASDKCQMCDLVYHGDQNLLSKIEFSAGELTTGYFNLYKLNLDSYCAVISASRAPPSLV